MRLGTRPTPEQIRAARIKYELTQRAAAELIYYTLSGWQRFEQGDRAMHPALWEYWQIRVKQQHQQRRVSGREN